MVIIVFILSLFIGSFLGVLVDRLPKGENVIWGRSYCNNCRRKLKDYDLIPVVSYFLLLGRCRFCHKKISIKYPIIELVTGISFAYIYLNLKNFALPSPAVFSFLFLASLFACLFVIFISDFQTLIIPNSIVAVGVIITLIYKLYYFPTALLPNILTGLIASFFLFILFWLTKGRGMGFGDVKYAFLMGLLLGFPQIIIAFYLAFLTGAVVGIILLLLRHVRFGQHIAFGPFLVIGTIITFIWKEKLLTLFLKFFY